MNSNYILTQQGYNEIEDELKNRINVQRSQIADKIEIATALGDLSENAAYSEALSEQQMNENRILELTDMIQNAIIADDSDTSKVNVGLFVTLKDLSNDKTIDYQVVGEGEANPLEMKISNTSPLGSSLLNKRVGDEVELSLPETNTKFKILKIFKK